MNNILLAAALLRDAPPRNYELTDRPAIFKRTDWGLTYFQANHTEIIEHRNKLVKSYGITRYIKKVPEYVIKRLYDPYYGRPIWARSLEVYTCMKGHNYIAIIDIAPIYLTVCDLPPIWAKLEPLFNPNCQSYFRLIAREIRPK